MNTIRCCISCILPCGSLDVIRIVHVNGRVEEITGTIYAAEILKAHPKHILKKPTSKPISEDIIETESAQLRPTIVVVSPDARLQRGRIYFLIPVTKSSNLASSEEGRRRKKDQLQKKVGRFSNSNSNSNNNRNDDKYLSEILSEKVSSEREKRRGRVGVWRPHLESITETLSDGVSSDL